MTHKVRAFKSERMLWRKTIEELKIYVPVLLDRFLKGAFVWQNVIRPPCFGISFALSLEKVVFFLSSREMGLFWLGVI